MNLILFGPPGAGKGTQAARLRDEFGVAHLSTGEMLRQAVAEGSAIGKKVKAVMDAGHLVSDALITGVLAERLAQKDCANGFILDGYPRTPAQAEALDALLEDMGLKIDAAIEIEVDEDILVERVAKRAREAGKTRSDDNTATLRERLRVYHEQTAPVLPYYRERQLLHSVDGMAPVDGVTRQIKAVLNGAAR